MKRKIHPLSIVCLALFAAGSSASAGVVLYQDNFESTTVGSSLTLPWTWSVETFADNAGVPGAYLSGYYPGNDASPGIHSVIGGQSGAQGNNALKIYGDYGYPPNHANNQWVVTNMYQNRTLTAGDIVDGGLMFRFDYAAFVGDGGIDATTIAAVYFQLLAPDFNTVWARQEVPITSADTNWQSGQLWFNLDAGTIGAQLQWGVTTKTQNYSDSAVMVDNLQVIPEPSGVVLSGLGVALLAFRRRRL